MQSLTHCTHDDQLHYSVDRSVSASFLSYCVLGFIVFSLLDLNVESVVVPIAHADAILPRQPHGELQDAAVGVLPPEQPVPVAVPQPPEPNGVPEPRLIVDAAVNIGVSLRVFLCMIPCA